MLNTKLINLKAIISLFIIFMVIGCASNNTRIPLYSINEPNVISRIEQITMLPVADIRKDKSSNKTDAIYKQLTIELANKGYVLRKADQFSTNRQIHPEEIEEMSVKEMAILGPSDSDYILICFLEDMEDTRAVIVNMSKVQVSAVLVDKRNKRYLWKDRAEVSIGKLGLVSALIPMDSLAVIESFKKLFSTFPEKG